LEEKSVHFGEEFRSGKFADGPVETANSENHKTNCSEEKIPRNEVCHADDKSSQESMVDNRLKSDQN
jgi:hypothetical protein